MTASVQPRETHRGQTDGHKMGRSLSQFSSQRNVEVMDCPMC